jgi:uncharacterized protein YcbK (DUF882 family)
MILAALVAACGPMAASAEPAIEKVSFQPQVKNLSCLKPETLAMIRELTERIGAIQITSTCGGRHARRSQHYSGNAIDFRPLHVSARVAARAARAIGHVGGVGTYRSGLVHADVGDRLASWHGRGKRSRVAYNR